MLEICANKEEELIKEWNNLQNFPNQYITSKNGENLWGYQFREKVKQISWRLINYYNKEKKYHMVCNYLLHGIIKSHYFRAREHIENQKNCQSLLKKIRGKNYYSKYTLDIDHYTEHWLWANGDRGDLFDIEAMEYMKNFYDPKESKYLPKGATCYQFKEVIDKIKKCFK